jgi:hypothetical protein
MAMPFPGKLRGRRAADVAREALSGHGIRRTVGIATVNALADCCWQRRPHPSVELRPGVDAFDATDIRHGDNVVVVGAFVPFLRELKRRRQAFLVLEQDPVTLKADELPFFRPAEQVAEILPNADVVLITGSTLVNNTLEHLLAPGHGAGARPYCIRVNAMPPSAGPEFARQVHFRHRIPIGYGAPGVARRRIGRPLRLLGGIRRMLFEPEGVSTKIKLARPPCRPVSRIKPGSGGVGHSAEFGEIFGFAIVARRRILQNTDDMGSGDPTAGQGLLGTPPSLVRVSAEHGLAG